MPTTPTENAVPTTHDLVNSYLTTVSTYVAKHGVRLSLLKKGNIVHSIEVEYLCDMQYATCKRRSVMLPFGYFFVGFLMKSFSLDGAEFSSKDNGFTSARFVHTFVQAINMLLPFVTVPLPDLSPKEIPKAAEAPPKAKKPKRKQSKPEDFYVKYENSEKGVKGFLRDFTSFNVDGITGVYETDTNSGHWGVEFKTRLKLYIYLAGHFLDESEDTASVSEENRVYKYKDGESTLQRLKEVPKKLSKYAEKVKKTSAR